MIKKIEDYIPELKQEFPDLTNKEIYLILNKGIKNIQKLIYRDFDVRIWNQNPGRDYHIAFVRSIKDDQERRVRAYRNKRRLERIFKDV